MIRQFTVNLPLAVSYLHVPSLHHFLVSLALSDCPAVHQILLPFLLMVCLLDGRRSTRENQLTASEFTFGLTARLSISLLYSYCRAAFPSFGLLWSWTSLSSLITLAHASVCLLFTSPFIFIIILFFNEFLFHHVFSLLDSPLVSLYLYYILTVERHFLLSMHVFPLIWQPRHCSSFQWLSL